MRLWELVFAVCALTDMTIQVPLFRNETALLSPSEHFQKRYLDYTLHPPGKARLLPTLSAEHIAESSVEEREWHFGPALSASGRVFFTVVTVSSLQVWTVVGRDGRRLWESEGPAKSVAVASAFDGLGFMYVSATSVLHFVDLGAAPITATAFSGLESSEASTIIICEGMNRVAVVHSNPGFVEMQLYELYYPAMTAKPRAKIAMDRGDEEVLKGVCTIEYYFLQALGVRIVSDGKSEYVDLSSSMGSYTSLKAIPDSIAVYAVGEKGVTLLSHDKVLVLPGVAQVLSLEQRLVTVTAFRSTQSVAVQAVEDWRLSEVQEVLVESVECEYQWAHSAAFDLLLQKKGQRMHIYSVEVDAALVAVEGREAPYTVDVCGVDSPACLSVMVETLQENSETAVLNIQSPGASVIRFSLPVGGRLCHMDLLFSNYISGANLNSSLSFTSVPAGAMLTFYPINQQFIEASKERVGISTPHAEFLCAAVSIDFRQLALLVGSTISTLYFTVENAELENIACAFVGTRLFVYGEAEGRMWLHQYDSVNTEKKEIGRVGGALVAMSSTPASIVLLFSERVVILNIMLGDWQTFMPDSAFLCMCQDSDTLVISSHASIEFLVSIGNHYISRRKIPMTVSARLCAYSRGTLMLLSGSDTVTVYHVSPSFQLTEQFSMPAHCAVTHIAAGMGLGAYRCPKYYQVLNVLGPKHSATVARIPTTQTAKFALLRQQYLIEVALEGTQFVLQKWMVPSINAMGYNVILRLSDDFELPRTAELIGELTVTSNDSVQRLFEVRISLENHYTISSRPPNKYFVSSVIEVPWGQDVALSPSHYFSGHNLHSSASASDPTVRIRLKHTVKALSSLTIAVFDDLISVSVEHGLAVTYHRENIIVSKYTCEDAICRIASKWHFPVSFILLLRLEVVLSTPRLVYLIVSGRHSDSCMVTTLYSLTPPSMQFEALLSMKCSTFINWHLIKSTDTQYHLFFYSSILRHCILHASESALSCSEVVHSALHRVVALGSHLVSASHWEVYALTATHRLVTMQLTQSVSVLTVADEHVLSEGSGANTIVVDRVIGSVRDEEVRFYSIPDLKLMHQIPFSSVASFEPSAQSFGEQGVLISMRVAGTASMIINASSGYIVSTVKSSVFAFTSRNTAIVYYNNSLSFLRISPGAVTVSQGDSATTAIVIVAGNALSESTVQVEVVWVQVDSWWAAVVVFAGLCGSLWCANKPHRALELEMERMTF